MSKLVDERARRRLRARFWHVLARYRITAPLLEDDLDGRAIEGLEAGVELWDAELLSTISDADLEMLVEVFAALRRVAEGSYGDCVACRARIPAAWLEAIPEASYCLGCARVAERVRRGAGADGVAPGGAWPGRSP